MLKEKINEDLKAAMKNKDGVASTAIREIKTKIMEAETAKGASALDDDGVMKVIGKIAKEKRESIEAFAKGNRLDMVEAERLSLAVVEAYLPKQMSAEEIELIVKEIVLVNGYTGVKDMGKVMKSFNETYAGQADGKTVGEIAKRLLA